MPASSEHKTVQARILAYAEEIGWAYVLRAKAEERRGFDPDGIVPEDRARNASLYFGELLHKQVLAFNTELLGLGRDVGDYVIVHELLHFAVPHHGKL